MPKKPRLALFLIISITLVAGYIDLPKITVFGKSISHPQIRTPWFARDLAPKLGLDLAGGVQLIMSADMSGVGENERDDALASSQEIIERRVNALGVTEAIVQTAKVAGQYRLIIEIPGIADIDQAVSTVKKTAHLEFKTLKATASTETTLTASPQDFEGRGLTGKNLKRAQAQPSQDPAQPGYIVNLEFDEEGAKKFEEITRNNLQKPVAIFLDDQIVSAPIVQAIISDGSAQITGNFTASDARQLVIELNAGALPVPLKIESQTRVGPTIGAESIEKSIRASLIGLASVIIFMTAYYGRLGIIASVALAIYTLIIFAIFKLIPVTLTLAGIAGFVLSIGMAVDANILIFERMKEELRWGKSRSEAIYEGFNRAWTSIRDSNVSSLITTAILFNFGTGSVRGFALTLAIGILVSMFSAIVVTRNILRIFSK